MRALLITISIWMSLALSIPPSRISKLTVGVALPHVRSWARATAPAPMSPSPCVRRS
jgi:hypothetical protein